MADSVVSYARFRLSPDEWIDEIIEYVLSLAAQRRISDAEYRAAVEALFE